MMGLNRQVLKSMLAVEEGTRLKPYDDATGKELKTGDTIKGKITIGVGWNIQGNGVTLEMAIDRLEYDIDSAEKALNTMTLYRTLDGVRQLVLADMCFNLGFSKLLGFKKMFLALRAKDYNLAATEMLDSKWYTQVGKRADNLAEMMRTGHI